MRWISKLSIPFILLVVTWSSANINWGRENWKEIVVYDASGYYAYLPAAFIYQDAHFGFHDSIEAKYYKPDKRSEYRIAPNGKVVNKYFVGTALAEMPFFLVAHTLTKFSSAPADGYSRLYPIFICIAAIVYLFVGLVFMRNLLRSFQVNDNLIAFLLLAMVFGTNLYYYVVKEPGMSHIYSFTFISMFVYYTRKFFIAFHMKHVLYCAVLLGITALIRPVNIMVILSVPFIAGSFSKLKEGFRVGMDHKAGTFIASALFVMVAGIQPMIYKIQTGSFFVYSYGEEGFNWSDPHMMDFLFSYKKGFFVYAPLCFVALTGFIYLWKHERFRFYSLLLFSVCVTYVLSSWWNWWYGGSFGSRVMIDYYIFFALLIAFAYKLFHKRIVIAFFTLLIVLPMLLCIIQTYQYRLTIIHWDSMTKEKYWDVFLKL